jgi:hypothetical protein
MLCAEMLRRVAITNKVKAVSINQCSLPIMTLWMHNTIGNNMLQKATNDASKRPAMHDKKTIHKWSVDVGSRSEFAENDCEEVRCDERRL